MAVALPTTEVRHRLGAILDQLKAGHQPVFITRHGETEAVLLSATEYAMLTEHPPEAAAAGWYDISQASLAQVWEHPDEDVYTWEDGDQL